MTTEAAEVAKLPRAGMKANARLIAAAPDMLAALKLAREIIEGHFQDDCEDCMAAHGAVCAAIAKATGKRSSASAQ